MACYANRISQIEQVKDLETLVSDHILANINLYPLSVALQVRESCLSHQPVRHNTPGDAHVHLLCLEIRSRSRTVLFHKVCGSCRPAKFMRIWVQPRRAELFQLLQPLFKLVPRLKFQVGVLCSAELSGSHSE